MCAAVLPHMVSRDHGRIINIGADSVRTGLTDHAVYNAAKGGVHAWSPAWPANSRPPVSRRTPSRLATWHTRTGEATESGEAPPRLERVVEEGTGIVPLGRPGRSG